MKNGLKKIADCLESISAVILLFMLVQVLLQVLFRFVLKISAPWTEEFARMGYIWLVFLMLPVLESRNDQLKVTYFFDKVPYKARVVLYWIMSLLYVIVLLCLKYPDFGKGTYAEWLGHECSLTVYIMHIAVMLLFLMTNNESFFGKYGAVFIFAVTAVGAYLYKNIKNAVISTKK